MRIKKVIKLEYISLLLLAALVLFSFHFFRFKTNTYLPGYTQYQYLSSIKSLKTSLSPSIFLKDTYGSDILVSLSKNPFFWMRFLPYLAALINSVLIFLILQNFVDRKHTMFSTIAIILSPVFVYVYGTYNKIFCPLFFLLLGVNSLLKDKYWLSLLSCAMVFILNPELFIVIILTLLVFYEKYKSKNIVLPILGILLTGILFINVKGASINYASFHSILTNYIADLGAMFGLGIFGVFISLFGILLSWNEKEKYSIIYVALFTLSLSALLDKTLLLFVQLFLAYFAGLGLKKIWDSKWESPTLKNYVLLLIFCGMLFSTGSFINKFSKSGPYHSEILSLEWLGDNYKEGKVLSHYKFGFLIDSLSDLDPYTDQRYYLLSKDKTRIKESKKIFESRDLEKIKQFMNKNSIKYIWINKEMKSGLVWKRSEEGILLILHNSIDFEQVYDYKGVEIWEFVMNKR